MFCSSHFLFTRSLSAIVMNFIQSTCTKQSVSLLHLFHALYIHNPSVSHHGNITDHTSVCPPCLSCFCSCLPFVNDLPCQKQTVFTYGKDIRPSAFWDPPPQRS
ncbi:hypothetical protein AMECASPLE_037972 [Ameca splendens]|uniref:Secreted protein n=1 Tax=Ameca splendens TaxID=208324 RepID=A0ABV0ZGT6_9TELE